MLLPALACASEPPAVRVEHRAVVGSDVAVTELSIAKGEEGLLLAWAEGLQGIGEPAWLAIETRETQPVHRAEIEATLDGGRGPFPRIWSRLVQDPLASDEIVRLAYRNDQLDVLRIDPSGQLDSHVALSVSTTYVPPRIPIADVNGRLFAVAFDFQGELSGVRLDDPDISSSIPAGGGRLPCDVPVFAAKQDEVTALVLFTSGAGAELGCGDPHVVLAELSSNGQSFEVLTYDSMDAPPGTPVALVTVESGYGTLWTRDGDGGLLLYAGPDASALEFGEATLTIEGEPTSHPRLLSTRDRLVVTWDDGSEGHAVVVDPAGPHVGDRIAWPLDPGCPVSDYVPGRTGLTYTCVGRCEGAGCTQSWLFVGRVDLAY